MGHDYPDAIRKAGPKAQQAYADLVLRLHAANGTAGPAELSPEEVALLLARLGKGQWPDMSHIPVRDEPTVLDDEA